MFHCIDCRSNPCILMVWCYKETHTAQLKNKRIYLLPYHIRWRPYHIQKGNFQQLVELNLYWIPPIVSIEKPIVTEVRFFPACSSFLAFSMRQDPMKTECDRTLPKIIERILKSILSLNLSKTMQKNSCSLVFRTQIHFRISGPSIALFFCALKVLPLYLPRQKLNNKQDIVAKYIKQIQIGTIQSVV